MFYNFNCATKAGMSHNEDSIFYNENLLIVMDAATDLLKTNLTDEFSDGRWFSKHAVSLLSKKLNHSTAPIHDVLAQVTTEIKHELDKLGYQQIPERYPSASLMIARILDNTLEIFSIGDCTAIIEFYNEYHVQTIHDDSVTNLDNTVIENLLSLQKKNGKSIANLIPEAQDMLQKNRLLKNTETGYWIYDPTGTAIVHGELYTFPCESVKSIAMMSDGFYYLSSVKNYSDDLQIIEALKHTSADTLIDEIYSTLDKDSDFNQFPRFKTRDDASVVYAEV